MSNAEPSKTLDMFCHIIPSTYSSTNYFGYSMVDRSRADPDHLPYQGRNLVVNLVVDLGPMRSAISIQRGRKGMCTWNPVYSMY